MAQIGNSNDVCLNAQETAGYHFFYCHLIPYKQVEIGLETFDWRTDTSHFLLTKSSFLFPICKFYKSILINRWKLETHDWRTDASDFLLTNVVMSFICCKNILEQNVSQDAMWTLYCSQIPQLQKCIFLQKLQRRRFQVGCSIEHRLKPFKVLSSALLQTPRRSPFIRGKEIG